MTGTPSQLCTSAQTFDGTAPTCDQIDMTEDDSNTQDVSVNIKKANGLDLGGNCLINDC